MSYVTSVGYDKSRYAWSQFLELSLLFFFFQAEDGIRDHCVTGVQTCALFFSSRRRHTRSLCDWSSDVCSSDLMRDGQRRIIQISEVIGLERCDVIGGDHIGFQTDHLANLDNATLSIPHAFYLHDDIQRSDDLGSKIGRASCRERV